MINQKMLFLAFKESNLNGKLDHNKELNLFLLNKLLLQILK